MSIYTRTGDFGETSLFGGARIAKNDPLVNMYGMIDELNSYLGLVVVKIEEREVKKFLQEVQKDLCSIESWFAGSTIDLSDASKRVKTMEMRIDEMDSTLPELHHFIIPGGSETASIIHIARSMTRTVERYSVYLLKQPVYQKNDTKNQVILFAYFNRLSDYLFVLARYINAKDGKTEILWNR